MFAKLPSVASEKKLIILIAWVACADAPSTRRTTAAHRGRRVVGDSAQSGRRHTRRVSMATDGDGSSVTLGRHVGSVKGASAGADGAAVVTVQGGDGVVLYDCNAQVRALSLLVQSRLSPRSERVARARRRCVPGLTSARFSTALAATPNPAAAAGTRDAFSVRPRSTRPSVSFVLATRRAREPSD